jgi:hypothetical protein
MVAFGGQGLQPVEPARKMQLGWIHNEGACDYTHNGPFARIRMVVIHGYAVTELSEAAELILFRFYSIGG